MVPFEVISLMKPAAKMDFNEPVGELDTYSLKSEQKTTGIVIIGPRCLHQLLDTSEHQCTEHCSDFCLSFRICCGPQDHTGQGKD